MVIELECDVCQMAGRGVNLGILTLESHPGPWNICIWPVKLAVVIWSITSLREKKVEGGDIAGILSRVMQQQFLNHFLKMG